MTTEQIKTFLIVADCLNFTKAAEKLYLTQPTISRQIRQLEEECKVALFMRNKKEVRLTPEGAVMVSHLKDALNAIQNGLSEVWAMSNGISGKLTIGALEGFEADAKLAGILANFGSSYPGLTLEIRYASFGDLRRGINNGTYDIIFSLEFESKNLPSLMIQKIFWLDAGIIVPRNSVLGQKENLCIEDLKKETFITTEEQDSPNRHVEIDEILNKYGFSCQKVKYVKNHESVLLNVAAGNGVAIISGNIQLARNRELFRYVELKKEEGQFLISAWKKENYNPALALLINSLPVYEV